MNKHFFSLSRVPVCHLFLVLLIAVFMNGCSNGNSGEGNIVATVNKEPIKLEDFQREMAIRAKQDPSYRITPEAIDKQIDTIIDRRLMIQEAMKMGLSNNKDFVRTIQTFWEQTLIRELIEAKNREWEKRLFVSEKEISDYHEKMQQMSKKDNIDSPSLQAVYDQIKRDILQQKKTDALETWLKEIRGRAVIEVNDKLLDTSYDVENNSGQASQSGHIGDGDGR